MFNKKLKEQLKSEKQKNEELNILIKSLLWNICSQKEKVSSDLSSLLPRLYPNRSSKELCEIKDRIIKSIKTNY